MLLLEMLSLRKGHHHLIQIGGGESHFIAGLETNPPTEHRDVGLA